MHDTGHVEVEIAREKEEKKRRRKREEEEGGGETRDIYNIMIDLVQMVHRT